jgi:Lrp/AsnC family transcriptional regulator, leucine-responsive regulatory protein
MDIEEKILKLIQSKANGILQNELWKTAKIDSSKCSRIVAKLEKEKLITREQDSSKGSKTYLIRSINIKQEKVKNYKLLLVEEIFSPCTGCAVECVPEHCIQLSEWVYRL